MFRLRSAQRAAFGLISYRRRKQGETTTVTHLCCKIEQYRAKYTTSIAIISVQTFLANIGRLTTDTVAKPSILTQCYTVQSTVTGLPVS